MNFDIIFGKQTKVTESGQAVIVSFNYGIDELNELHELADKLAKEIKDNGLGEYDGHEIAMDYSDGTLYMYGSNAENLFKGIQSILQKTDFMKGAIVKLRFGPPEDGVSEIEFEL